MNPKLSFGVSRAGMDGRGGGRCLVVGKCGGYWQRGGGLEEARGPVDGFEGWDGGGLRGGLEFLEFAGADEDTGFVSPDGAVVMIDSRGEGTAKFAEVLGEFAKAFVQGAAEDGNFASVFGDGFLAPPVGDGTQQGNEGRRGGEDDALVHAAFDEARVALQGGGEKRFARQKQDGEFGRVGKLCSVIF